jgi:hypothetical protein
MTNFDVWRQSLTPEIVAEFLDDAVGDCELCPAWNACDGDTQCRDAFLDWAYQEAES